MAKVYYVDPLCGNDAWDGLSCQTPKKEYRTIHPQPGDSILFRRGRVMRDVLMMRPGSEGARITYGAYGQGDKPVFLGSMDLSDPAVWAEESPHLWVYNGDIPLEVCNFVFDHGKSFGNLRWEIADLDEQGEWYYSHMGKIPVDPNGAPQKLYLYSEKNPGESYTSIECVIKYHRMAGIETEWGLHHVTLQDISFENFHEGFQSWIANDITIRRCDFRYVGGAVWSRERRIRCGNAIEFWEGADNILIEECLFDEIYDSAITHQGTRKYAPSRRFVIRNNIFRNCGMAAYEVRDFVPIDSHFDNNLCLWAGGGFAMQNEQPPRQSEIYPEPMGHHVFLWRMPVATEDGGLTIRNNIFCEAPYGAAIYSIISPEAEAQLDLGGNVYCQSADQPFWHYGGKDYTIDEFTRYQAETGRDIDSIACGAEECKQKILDAGWKIYD